MLANRIHPPASTSAERTTRSQKHRSRRFKIISLSILVPSLVLPRSCQQEPAYASFTPKVQIVAPTSVSVSWTATKGAMSYDLGVVDSVSTRETVTRVYSTKATVSGLPTGSLVTVRVRAVEKSGAKRWSHPASVQLAGTTTTVPSTVTVTTVPTVTTTPPTVPPTSPPTTAAPTTAAPTTAAPTTAAPTTAAPTTAAPTTAAPTTVPATSPPVASGFPTAATTGVPAGTALVTWSGPLRTSQVNPTSTETRNGMSCRVYDRFAITTVGTQTMYVDSPCVVFKRSRFAATGDWFAIVNTSSDVQYLEISDSEFDGGPYHVRGVQADYGSLTVLRSEFTRFGNAGVEMTDRSTTRTMTVTDSYFYEPGGWPHDQHVDGIQMNAGGSAVIRNNTVLVTPYGGTVGDTSYVSNATIGIGTALGDIGSVVIDRNLLAGGGFLIYVQDKAYTWRGAATVTNNVFDRRYTPQGAIWGPLYPTDVAPALVWTGNYWDGSGECTLSHALS